MSTATTDLCDAHPDKVQALHLQWRDFGGRRAFYGAIETIRAFEDNSRVRECVETPGTGKVLVIDGGASLRRAMLGDQLAARAVANGWSGIIVHGAIRDAAALAAMDIGIKALGTCPVKTAKLGRGAHNVPLRFGGVTILPGQFLYADADGVVVAAVPLHA
jgi:regulator of ribonuclease activity A